jgi:predicted membrane channel-forming protein YqfA (hemolysin III family)
VDYNRRNMTIAIFPFCVGLFFFYLGLDEKNDYLRLLHGAWHFCAGIFGYYCFTSVSVITTDKRGHMDDSSTGFSFD